MKREEALLFATMPQHRALVRRTLGMIQESLTKVSTPYVACSFGKDSSVMLHLVRQFTPDIQVRFVTHPETRLLGNYDEILASWDGINLQEIYLHRDHARETRGNTQRDALEADNHDSFFVGLRADESKGRAMTLKTHGVFSKQKRTGRIRICPVAWWSEKDIIAYTYVNNIPLLKKYQDMGTGARTTTGLPHNGFAVESFQHLRQFNPTAWNELNSIYSDLNDLL